MPCVNTNRGRSPPRSFSAGHTSTRAHQPFVAMRLRSKIDGMSRTLPREFRAGFIDALYRFVTAALGGKAPDPLQWDVLSDVERQS